VVCHPLNAYNGRFRRDLTPALALQPRSSRTSWAFALARARCRVSTYPGSLQRWPTTSVRCFWHIKPVGNDANILAVRGTVVKSLLTGGDGRFV